MKLVIKERQVVTQATLDGQPIDFKEQVAEIIVNGQKLIDQFYRFKLNDKLTLLLFDDNSGDEVVEVSTKAIKNDDKAVSPILNQELFTVTPITGGVRISPTYTQWEDDIDIIIGDLLVSLQDGYYASCISTGFKSEDAEGDTYVYVVIWNNENAVFNAFMWTTAGPK